MHSLAYDLMRKALEVAVQGTETWLGNKTCSVSKYCSAYELCISLTSKNLPVIAIWQGALGTSDPMVTSCSCRENRRLGQHQAWLCNELLQEPWTSPYLLQQALHMTWSCDLVPGDCNPTGELRDVMQNYYNLLLQVKPEAAKESHHKDSVSFKHYNGLSERSLALTSWSGSELRSSSV